MRGTTERLLPTPTDVKAIASHLGQVSARAVGMKKRRGRFYTPNEVSKIVSNWAVRKRTDLVLEPSFGGCGFLAAIHKRLVTLKSRNPWSQISGCDIDARAFSHHLPTLKISEINKRNFIHCDFLQLEPVRFANKFDAIIGNPPYVSHHNMYKAQKFAAQQAGNGNDFRLSGMSSLWAYFVFHSMQFLKSGGRMAWLLPSSSLHADYAHSLLGHISNRFGRMAVISLQEKYFQDDGASETTEILFCDGYGLPSSNVVETRSVLTLDDCSALLKRWTTAKRLGRPSRGEPHRSFVPVTGLKTFDSIASSSDVIRLGDIAKLSIGLVTGANRFFVIDNDRAKENDLPPSSLTPILSKIGFAKGLQLRASDLRNAKSNGNRCLLVAPIPFGKSKAVVRYFKKFPKVSRYRNVTFRKRQDWRRVDDGKNPTAFLSYMNHLGPKLVINSAKVNCTNTIHRVYVHGDVNRTALKVAAVCMVSTFSQLSAELKGRVYGDGVLKHELGEAAQIELLFPMTANSAAIAEAYSQIDSLLREGESEKARIISDEFLRSVYPRLLSLKKLNVLRRLLRSLRARRHRQSK
jgi:adenine-specific DNA methylase